MKEKYRELANELYCCDTREVGNRVGTWNANNPDLKTVSRLDTKNYILDCEDRISYDDFEKDLFQIWGI